MQTWKMNLFKSPLAITSAMARHAAAVSFVLVASFTATLSNAATVLMNGDFETLTSEVGLANGGNLQTLQSGSGASWDVFSSITGWTGGGAGIEVQTTRTGIIAPHSGNHYVELDSHGGASNSSMSQDLVLDKGEYELSFWYSPRVNQEGTDTNTIQFSIGGLLDTVSGPGGAGGTSVGDWTLVTGLFMVDADSTALTLTLRALGLEETLGGFIDDVSITAVPLPAAAWLFGSALLGLVTVARRKAAL